MSLLSNLLLNDTMYTPYSNVKRYNVEGTFCTPRQNCLLHPIFIRPHRKEIGHDHNPDAPRERNPNIISDRLPRQERADGVHYRGHRLIFGKGSNYRRHRLGWNERRTDKWKEDKRVGKGACAVHRFCGQSGNHRNPSQGEC